VCHTGLLTANLYDTYHCCVYSENLLMMERRNCSKHVEFYSKNKLEKLMHLVGFIIRIHITFFAYFNPLTPNDDYSGRTAPLTSKRCILYIYSTPIGNEYFKRGIYSPFFPLQNAVCFICLTYLVPVLFTFYIESVLKLKK